MEVVEPEVDAVEEAPAPELIWDPALEEDSADAAVLNAGECEHTGDRLAEDEEPWYEALPDDPEAEQNQQDDGSGNHHVWVLEKSWRICDICEEEYLREKKMFLDGPHSYGMDDDLDACELCGYSRSGCPHENVVQRTWKIREGASDDCFNGNHSTVWYTMGSTYCCDCDQEWGEHEIDSWTVEEPHIWSGDDGTSCKWCDAVNPCENHYPVNDGEAYFYSDDLDFATVVKASDGDMEHAPTAEGHYYKLDYGYQPMKCEACGAQWDEYIDGDVYVMYDHEWAADGATCEVCGYTSECPHENKEWHEVNHRNTFDWTDESDPHAPQPLEGGKQHRAWGVDGKEWYCEDCDMSWGFVANDGDVEHWITEDHQWDNRDGEIICWVCGEKNTCDHANRDVTTEYEPHDGDYDNLLAFDKETHTLDADKVEHWSCPDCGLDGVDVSYIGEKSIPHVYRDDDDGRDPTHCDVCGYYNGCDTDHAGAQEWDGFLWNEGDPKPAGDNETHTGMGRHATGEWCADCEDFVSLTFDGPTGEQSEPHNWNTDEYPIVCDRCGFEIDCDHEGAEINNHWYDPLDEENGGDSWNPAYGSRDEKGHTNIPAVEHTEYNCPKCGLTYTIHNEEGIATGDHEWKDELDENGHTVCRICGYVSQCAHAHVVTDEWDETDYDGEKDDPVIRSNALSCEVRIRSVRMQHCLDCDAHWGWQIVGIRIYTGEHEWDPDQGGNFCRWCERENTCDHQENLGEYYVEIYDEGYYSDPENPKHKGLEPIEGVECHAICTHWVDGHCDKCGADFHIEDTECEYKGPHQWNGDDGKTCELCGAENSCQHEDVEPSIWLEWNRDINDDDRGVEEGVISRDENGHTVYVRRCQMMHCNDCELDFDWKDIGIESEEQVRELLKDEGFTADFEFDVDTSVLTGPHIWNANDGGYECMFCGYGNPCDHKKTEYIYDWYDLTDDSETVYDDDERHVIEHTDHRTRVRCLDCDMEIIYTDEDVTWEGEHEWRAFDPERDAGDEEEHISSGAICDDCGYEKFCTHPESFVHTEDWWELPDGEEFTEIDRIGHTGMLQHVQETYCDQCGASWDWEVIEEAQEEQRMEHEWEYDEERQVSFCSVCGYENKCEHEYTIKVGEWYDWDGATASKKTATQHTMQNAYRVEEFECEDCGAYFQKRTKGSYTDDHEWDEETGTKCAICGYANPCKHPAEQVEFETWYDPDMSRGGIKSVDSKGHTMFAVEVGQYHCYACDTRWGWQEVSELQGENEDGSTWEEHDWDEDGFCRVCNYENECPHWEDDGDKDFINEWYENIVVDDDPGREGHLAHGTHYVEWRCQLCGMVGVFRDDNAELPRDHEWDGENGAKKCWICGFANPCKHPASMVHTDTWEEPDGENYPGGGVVTKNDDTCTVYARTIQEKHCDQCGMDYDRKVIKSGYTRSGPHEWDEEHGDMCVWCEAENSCSHVGADEVDSWEEPMEEDPYFEQEGMEGHSFEGILVRQMHCNKCGADFRVVDDLGYITWGHNWHWDEEEQAPVCQDCGYVMDELDCNHGGADLDVSTWYDVDLKNGGILSSSAKNHTGWFFEVKGYYCPDCDTHIDVEFNDKSKKLTLAHEWAYDEGGAYCVVCGYVNTCTHAKATVVNEWFEPDEDSYDSSEDPAMHTMDGTYIRELHCPSCNADFREEEWVEDFTGEHEWEWDEDESVCRICGATAYDTYCDHENVDEQSFLRPARNSQENRQFIMGNRSKNGHKVPVEQVFQDVCNDCGAILSYSVEPVVDEEDEPLYVEGAHEWGDDGYCIYCAWKNTCTKHKSVVRYSGLGLPEKVQIVNQSVTGHTVVYVTYNANYCSTCGAYLGTTVKAKSEKQVTEPHVFDEEGFCYICGWKNSCTHPAAFVEEEEGFSAYGDQVVSADDYGHTVYGVRYTQKHCTLCDAYFGYEEMPGERETDEHHWDDATGTYCDQCGYKNPCNHKAKGATKKINGTSDEDNMTIYIGELATLGRHAKIVRKASFTECTKCGAKYGFTFTTTEVEMEEHDFSGDSATICTICGYDTQGKEVLETLSFDEPEEGIVLGVGEKYLPKLDKYPEGAASEIKFDGGKSGKTTVFKVSEAGEITANAKGTATLSATWDDNPSDPATLTVTVKEKPSSISLNAKTLELGVGENTELKATLGPKNSAGTITWTISGEPDVIEYDEETGMLMPVGVGTATITAAVYSGKSASCTVTVKNAPDESNMIITAPDVMGVGESASVSFSYIDAAGAHSPIQVKDSSDVLKLTEKSGKYTVKANRTGSAVLYVDAYNHPDDDEDLTGHIEWLITVLDAPDKVAFDADSVKTISVGETGYRVHAVATKGGKANDPEEDPSFIDTVTYSSSSTGVLAVDAETGELTAKKAGTATITAKSYNGKIKDTLKIIVKKAPTAIKLDKASLELGGETESLPGATETLKATLTPKDAGGEIIWKSNNEDTATVENGVVTAHEPGEAVITACVYDSKIPGNYLTAYCRVTVYEAPTTENMHVWLPKDKLSKGDAMIAEVVFDGDAKGSYEWEISDTALATLDKKTGKITANKKDSGTVTVTATAYNGVKVSEEFELCPAPKKVVGVEKSRVLSVGEFYYIKVPTLEPAGAVSELTVTNSNAKVVELNPETVWVDWEDDVEPFEAYEIHAIKDGSATITLATFNKSVKATCSITVKKAPTGIKLNKAELEMIFDDTGKYTSKPQTITATLSPSKCGGKVEWISSNVGVATVENGKITPVGLGRTIITARVENYETGEEFEASCTVRVCDVPRFDPDDEWNSNIRLEPVKGQIGDNGGTTQLYIEYIGSAGAVKANTYKVVNSATDGKIVSVDAKTGKVTAKKGQAGKTAHVQVTMFNGVVLTTEIEVINQPDSIDFYEGFDEEGDPIIYKEKTLHVGDSFTIEVLFNTDKEGGSTADVTWTTSSNKSIVSLDADDVKNKREMCTIHALKKGTVTITAKSHNNKTCKLTVTVEE